MLHPQMEPVGVAFHNRVLAEDAGHYLVDWGRLLEDWGRLLEDLGRLLEDWGRLLEDLGRLLDDCGALLEDWGRFLVLAGGKDEGRKVLAWPCNILHRLYRYSVQLLKVVVRIEYFQQLLLMQNTPFPCL